MVVLSNYHHSTKGILLFKHLEQNVLNELVLFPRLLAELRSKFYLGLYFGGTSNFTLKGEIIDFILSEEGTILNEDQAVNVPVIRLSGYNFVPDRYISLRDNQKIWDVIGVFNNSRFKKIEDFLSIVIHVKKSNPDFKALLLTYGPEKNYEKFDLLLKEHQNVFNGNSDSVDSLDVLKLAIGSKSFLPTSHDTIMRMMSHCKTFLLTSIKEGASRVLSEALVLGLNVMVRADLKGGSLARLRDKDYAHLFIKEEDAVKILQERLQKGWFEVESSFVEQNFLESRSVNILYDSLCQVLPESNKDWVNYGGISYSKLIPSHANVIDSKYTCSYDDQFGNLFDLVKYVNNELTSLQVNPFTKLRLTFSKTWRSVVVSAKKKYRVIHEAIH